MTINRKTQGAYDSPQIETVRSAAAKLMTHHSAGTASTGQPSCCLIKTSKANSEKNSPGTTCLSRETYRQQGYDTCHKLAMINHRGPMPAGGAHIADYVERLVSDLIALQRIQPLHQKAHERVFASEPPKDKINILGPCKHSQTNPPQPSTQNV